MSLKIGNVTPDKIFCTTASGEVDIKKVYVGTKLIWADEKEYVRQLGLDWRSYYQGVYDTLQSFNNLFDLEIKDEVLLKISSPKYSLEIKDSDIVEDSIMVSFSNVSFSQSAYPKGYRLPFKRGDILTAELLASAVNKEFVSSIQTSYLKLHAVFFVQGDSRFDSAKARVFGKSGYQIRLEKKDGGGIREVSEDGEQEWTLSPGAYYLYATYPKGETIMTLQQDAVSRSYSVRVDSVTLA